jgi:glycine/serine hydroxymethyltransferase
MFQKFRAWLLAVYKDMKALRVELTDDVRGVMGRMLASTQAIQEAEAARRLGPLFKTAEDAGMSLDEFKAYHAQVVKNAQVVAETLTARGLRIVSGRTESHVMLVDLRAKGITGKAAEAALGAAHITINKNSIPNDPEKPMVTSGIRVGTPAMTTRGFKEEEARITANLVADVLDNPNDEANLARVRAEVAKLTARFPVYQ